MTAVTAAAGQSLAIMDVESIQAIPPKVQPAKAAQTAGVDIVCGAEGCCVSARAPGPVAEYSAVLWACSGPASLRVAPSIALSVESGSFVSAASTARVKRFCGLVPARTSSTSGAVGPPWSLDRGSRGRAARGISPGSLRGPARRASGPPGLPVAGRRGAEVRPHRAAWCRG